jgi:hypothetical protein
VIGKLMYAIVHTRPNIAFTLGKLSQHMQNPSEQHWTYLKGLMRYLWSTIDLKLYYGPKGHTKLSLYTDADWAGQKNDRKSTTGGVAIFYRGLIN